MEQDQEFKTVYYVATTAPYANNEEEIATSFIVDTDENGDQVIILSEDVSIVNENGTIITEDECSQLESGHQIIDENLNVEDSSGIDTGQIVVAETADSGVVVEESMVVELANPILIKEEALPNEETDSDCGGPYDNIQKSDDVPPKSPCKTIDGPVDKFTCRYCGKKFTKSGNKMRHIRLIHKIKKKEVGSHIKCIECNISYKHVKKLRDHLSSAHKLNMDEEEIRFPNMAAFKKWKHDIERKELTSYTMRHGARKTVNGVKYFYICHRSGKYESKVKTDLRQRMLKTPGTCKLGIVCTAAIYCEECPNAVIVRYCPYHYGHGKETSFVQLSNEEQAAIQENVSNGIPFENLLDDIRDNQSSTDHFQLYLLKKRDIRFINNAFNTVEYNPGLTDAESVIQWVQNCTQMEDSPILHYQQEDLPNGDENFLLIIMTMFQKQILLSSERHLVCVDSLYRRKGGRFYLTVLFIMDEYDIAFPVAYCISSKVDKSVMCQFFQAIRNSTGPLDYTYFMSDSETFYYEAWVEVMEASSKWLWSMWYVDSRIRVQLRIFKGNILKRAEVYKTMRVLLECQNQNVFNSMFKNYVDSLIKDPASKTLGNFILQKYGNNAHMWAYCHRKEIKLSTNIHLEVMHRTFRYCCREGRKKRLDKFIFVIMKLVRYKMLDRLTLVLDEEKIGLAVSAINMFHNMGLEIPSVNISSLSDQIWLVSSEEEDSVYVTREFESCPEHCNLKCSECDVCVHMYSCSCVHSMINANLCQHIHAVVWKFLTPHFSPPNSPGAPEEECMEQVCEIDPGPVVNAKLYSKKSTELLDSVLKRTHDLYKVVRSNKCNVSNDSLTAIMKRLNESIDICLGKAPPEKKSEPDKNTVYVINPFVRNTNQQLILPKPTLQPIVSQPKQMGQYVLLLPSK